MFKPFSVPHKSAEDDSNQSSAKLTAENSPVEKNRLTNLNAIKSDYDSPAQSTGSSLNDTKKRSPRYAQQEKTFNEQHFIEAGKDSDLSSNDYLESTLRSNPNMLASYNIKSLFSPTHDMKDHNKLLSRQNPASGFVSDTKPTATIYPQNTDNHFSVTTANRRGTVNFSKEFKTLQGPLRQEDFDRIAEYDYQESTKYLSPSLQNDPVILGIIAKDYASRISIKKPFEPNDYNNYDTGKSNTLKNETLWNDGFKNDSFNQTNAKSATLTTIANRKLTNSKSSNDLSNRPLKIANHETKADKKYPYMNKNDTSAHYVINTYQKQDDLDSSDMSSKNSTSRYQTNQALKELKLQSNNESHNFYEPTLTGPRKDVQVVRNQSIGQGQSYSGARMNSFAGPRSGYYTNKKFYESHAQYNTNTIRNDDYRSYTNQNYATSRYQYQNNSNIDGARVYYNGYNSNSHTVKSPTENYKKLANICKTAVVKPVSENMPAREHFGDTFSRINFVSGSGKEADQRMDLSATPNKELTNHNDFRKYESQRPKPNSRYRLTYMGEDCGEDIPVTTQAPTLNLNISSESSSQRGIAFQDTNDFLTKKYSPFKREQKTEKSYNYSRDVSPFSKIEDEYETISRSSGYNHRNHNTLNNAVMQEQVERPRELKMDRKSAIASDQKSNPSSQQMSRNFYAEKLNLQVNPNIMIERYNDGSIYEGEMQNEQRHGKGKYIYEGGGYYDGEWIMGRMEGYGTLYYANGKKVYEGDWENDKYHGKGIVYNEYPDLSNTSDGTQSLSSENCLSQLMGQWTRYEGEFRDDKWDGVGKLLFANGEEYFGEFRNGCVHGKGTYHIRSGGIVIGLWESNKLIKTL